MNSQYSGRERETLLAALDAAQKRERAADARTHTALERAHRLERLLDSAHRLIAAQTRRISDLTGQPVAA